MPWTNSKQTRISSVLELSPRCWGEKCIFLYRCKKKDVLQTKLHWGAKALLLPADSLYAAPVTMLAEYYARKSSAAFGSWEDMRRRIFSAPEFILYPVACDVKGSPCACFNPSNVGDLEQRCVGCVEARGSPSYLQQSQNNSSVFEEITLQSEASSII